MHQKRTAPIRMKTHAAPCVLSECHGILRSWTATLATSFTPSVLPHNFDSDDEPYREQ